MRNMIVLRASKRNAAMVQQADLLVSDLEVCCRLAAATGYPGLASLEKALIRAKRLREMVPKCDSDRWEVILEAIICLSTLARKICSILNCKKSQEDRNESWVDHKNAAYSRWIVTDCLSRENWSNKGLFVVG